MTLLRIVFTGIVVACVCWIAFIVGYLGDTYKILTKQFQISEVSDTNDAGDTSDADDAVETDPSNLPTKYILYYTTYFQKPFNIQPQENCSKPCVFTNDRTLLPSMGDYDALLFHARDLCFTSQLPDPKTRRSNQVYVLVNRESPMLSHNDLELDRYRSFFNWTMTYRNDSDVPAKYGEYRPKEEIKDEVEFEQEIEEMMQKKSSTANPAIWIVSNCVEHRMKYAKELMKHLKVTTYGRCFNTKIDNKDRVEEIKKHKFYLSFENSYCTEYITEKFWFMLDYGTVPVALGGTGFEHRDAAPPNSFVNAKDFSTPKDLAEYLNFLNENDEEYKKYLQWRRYYEAKATFLGNNLCDICEKLHDPELKHKTYENMYKWFDEGKCYARKSREPFPCQYTDDMHRKMAQETKQEPRR